MRVMYNMWFVCNWPKCGFSFKQRVGQVESVSKEVRGGFSTVVCPQCGNNLKISEAKKVRKLGEYKGAGR